VQGDGSIRCRSYRPSSIKSSTFWCWDGAQEKGLDTVDANRALGLPDDCREYNPVRYILEELGVKSVRLMVSTYWPPLGVLHGARSACSRSLDEPRGTTAGDGPGKARREGGERRGIACAEVLLLESCRVPSLVA
jgi:hypothetical protein